ncbi:probable ATP-dependent RNA helicase DDX28 [Megalops cyprinoides]|uniref:probable ATP-dependent RNA helicase DDX28 n=1 Tax=Megalops cyprinoides TaxID=118141 RepID=UPI00186424FB|nr:probable ATP-dependent RNA helicase DDX28 [Megalops cyprinoides]
MLSLRIGYNALTTSGQTFSSANKLRAAVCSLCDFEFAKVRAMATTTTTQPVVIRIPRRMQIQMENDDMKRKRVQKVNTVRPGKLLIVSKNPKLNQSVGHALGKFEQPLLTSKGWKHSKSFGDYFTVNNTKDVAPFITERPQEEKEEATSKTVTFKSFKLLPEIVEALARDNIIYPTTIQLKAIPKILHGHNVIAAAETGSGKTLSYLLPIIHKLKEERAAEEYSQREPQIGCVILVPSRELADQVTSVAKALCNPFGMTVKTVGGGRGVGAIKQTFRSGPPDILVATPGALCKALRRHCLHMSELTFFVVDEADTLFDPSFVEMVEDILSHTQVASSPLETKGPGRKAQLVVVGATFPGGVEDILSQVTDVGSIVTIKSQMLHFLMPHVKQTFLKVKGEDKLLELRQALKVAEQDGSGVLVFCNGSSTVNWLGYMLEDLGVRHVRLQGEMPAALRAGIFRSFQKGLVNVLLCTDIASRGLDTQRVKLVINYDFPESHTDYIHRAGRVGRAGSSMDGAVLSFVTHPWDVELVQMIETAARRRSSLAEVKSAFRKPAPKNMNSN